MKKVWPIRGLDCANCAQQLENALSRVPGVENVRVNYMASTITLEAADEAFAQVTEAVLKKAARVEPEAEILADGAAPAQHHDHDHGEEALDHHHHHHDDDEHEHHHHHHDDGDNDECHCGHGHHHHDDDDDDDDECHCGHEHHHHHDDDDDDGDECHCGHEHHHHHDDDDDDDDDGCHCGHEHHHHHDHGHCDCGHDHPDEKPLDETSPVAEGLVRNTWPIHGLDCANCAQQLENALAELPDVKSVRVSYMNGKVQLVCAPEQVEPLKKAMADTCLRVEPDAVIDFGAQPKAAAERKQPEKEKPVLWYRIGVTVLLSAAALLLVPESLTWLRIVLFLSAYLSVSYDVLLRAVRNISRGQIFDENFLMTVASLGAMAMQEFTEAVAVMTLYQIGEWFQDKAVEKSRASIASLMDIRPDYANVLREGRPVTVDPNEVRVGELILVKPGEKLPLDGVVTEGHSSLNTVALTGESLPRDVAEGDSVISGCVNLSGVITVRVTAAFGDSTVARILELVETSGDSKARAERFISKFARYYTPAVCGAALLLALVPPLLLGSDWQRWITQALSFLVISCPCALVISVPLSFFSGIGGASRKGILIKGANYMEVLAKLDTVAFDKTGTLTRGVFSVTAVHPEKGVTEARLLETAALAECYSDHPISKSLQKAYGSAPDRSRVAEVKEIAGHGISALVDGRQVLAGNDRLMATVGIRALPCEKTGTIVHIAENGAYLGHIVISDELKPTTKQAMTDLKETGVQRLVMLTGDRKEVADHIARELGMTDVRAQLLP